MKRIHDVITPDMIWK